MQGRHIDSTFAALIESINQPYLEYVKIYTELEKEKLHKKIEILTIINFLEKYSFYYKNIRLYIISHRYDSMFSQHKNISNFIH